MLVNVTVAALSLTFAIAAILTPAPIVATDVTFCHPPKPMLVFVGSGVFV
jgi:hypothetical protein